MTNIYNRYKCGHNEVSKGHDNESEGATIKNLTKRSVGMFGRVIFKFCICCYCDTRGLISR